MAEVRGMIQQQQAYQQRRFEVERERWREEGPSVGEAISRVAEAGQNLIVDRLDLLKVEAKAAVDEKVTALTEAGKSMGMLAIAGIILRGGWVTLMVGVGFWLSPRITVAGALALIGAVHVVVAGILLATARKKTTTAAKAARGELRQEQLERERPATAGV